jgi:hypothetical protein
MALKKMTDLKDVFNGISSVLFQTTPLVTGDSIAIAPEYELPVEVDSITISQDDPTINNYRVHGLSIPWTTSSEVGDVNLDFIVPTNHTDVLKLAYGNNAVTSVSVTVTGAAGDGGDASGSWTGNSVKFSKTKVVGCIALLNESKDKLLVINNVALYAAPQYDNASTEPFAIHFVGSMEAGGTQSAGDMVFLTKGS